MTTETPNYDPAFFQHIREQDKENILKIQTAIQNLPEVRRKLFEMHQRYTKSIQELTVQLSREKDPTTKKLLEKELACYQASLEHIEPAYRKEYVKLQVTLMNNLHTIQSAHDATEHLIKEKNFSMNETSVVATNGTPPQKR